MIVGSSYERGHAVSAVLADNLAPRAKSVKRVSLFL